jgi:hypothetical protein
VRCSQWCGDVERLLHLHCESLASPEVQQVVEDSICLPDPCIDSDTVIKIIGEDYGSKICGLPIESHISLICIFDDYLVFIMHRSLCVWRGGMKRVSVLDFAWFFPMCINNLNLCMWWNIIVVPLAMSCLVSKRKDPLST